MLNLSERVRIFAAVSAVYLLFSCANSLAAVPTQQASPFCSDSGCAETRVLLKQMCDYIVAEKATVPHIYVGGYYMRTLVDGYEILGDRRYLDTALAYGDYLLKHQMSNGLWSSGYGWVALADTGSALGLFSVLYKHADSGRRKQYLDAALRYADSIQKNGMMHPDGAFGDGWGHVKGDNMSDWEPHPDEYTLSTALTGGEIFTWLYHLTGKDDYREIAHRAMQWILNTMRSDGNIPYDCSTEKSEKADLAIKGDPENDYNLWTKMTFGNIGYVGEGILAFDLHCNQPVWRAWIEKAVRPNIEFLLQNQLPDGTWSKLPQTSWDRTRAPSVIDYLIWYYVNVKQDPRIAKAVQRFDTFILDPERGRSYGQLNRGAKGGEEANAFNTATALTGRALTDILSPDVDSKW